MANDHKFLRMLMDRILESHLIPKVQVERVVSPVLSLFIADVLTKTFENHEFLRGIYELVCMEFPLKKPENMQSTNIDFLFVNQTTSSTVFLEIKTDSDSLDRDQLEIYTKLRDEVKEFGGGFLLRNLNEIANHSAKGNKYSFLQKMIEPHKKTIVGSSDLQIIYLVPHDIKLRLIAENRVDAVLAYTDLPAHIDCEFKEEWSVIRESLVKLERMEILLTLIQLREQSLLSCKTVTLPLQYHDSIMREWMYESGSESKFSVNRICRRELCPSMFKSERPEKADRLTIRLYSQTVRLFHSIIPVKYLQELPRSRQQILNPWYFGISLGCKNKEAVLILPSL